MSGLKNFERIKKKRYPYKMRQVLLDNEQEFLFEFEEYDLKKLLNPNDLMHLVFSLDENLHPSNLAILELSVYNSLIKRRVVSL
ncbi:hypothetical protein [Helicobacter pylori]|uniref:hypothetical protein n=1 Tax=Helicobacter pylori TaxID=210 RepID=UPI001F0B94E0|nr:hypothetical protein [Helicobacter pylori]